VTAPGPVWASGVNRGQPEAVACRLTWDPARIGGDPAAGPGPQP